MTTKKGVWNLQQVRDKQLQSLWSYSGAAGEPGELWVWGRSADYGQLGVNTFTYYYIFHFVFQMDTICNYYHIYHLIKIVPI